MGSSSQKQWDGKSRGGRFGHQFFVGLIRLFGVKCAYCFLAFIVIYFIPFAPKATRAIWQYNRRIRGLGVCSSIKELYCHYFVFGQTLIDKIAIKGGMSDSYNFKFENYKRFSEILENSNGLIMIGAHIGCWEAGAGYFSEYGKKLNIVMLDAEHQQIKDVLEQSAEQRDSFNLIPLNQDGIGAMLQIRIALNNGEFVCFNGDRYMAEDNVAKVEFLGAEAKFPLGIFKIAQKCRVPIVFYYAMRESGCTYRFIFEEPLLEGKYKAEDLLREYTQSLEKVVTKYPRQWFNFYNFWKFSKS